MCHNVSGHNTITNAITSPPVWPVHVEMKHMPQKKGAMCKLDQSCSQRPASTIHIAQQLIEWTSGFWQVDGNYSSTAAVAEAAHCSAA